jgi:leader peptidase (prepilin peptidase)/N-methyltransferase
MVLPVLAAIPAGWLAAELAGRLACGAGSAPGRPALLAAIGIAVLAVALLPPALVWPGCVLGWLLLALALADAAHLLLPDPLTLAVAVLGLVLAPVAPADALAGAAIGFLLLWAVRSAYRAVRGRDGLGLGDAKLLAAGGIWVGWQGVPLVLLGAALATLAAAVALRRLRGDDAVPFGPGLAGGIWVTFLAAAA